MNMEIKNEHSSYDLTVSLSGLKNYAIKGS